MYRQECTARNVLPGMYRQECTARNVLPGMYCQGPLAVSHLLVLMLLAQPVAHKLATDCKSLCVDVVQSTMYSLCFSMSSRKTSQTCSGTSHFSTSLASLAQLQLHTGVQLQLLCPSVFFASSWYYWRARSNGLLPCLHHSCHSCHCCCCCCCCCRRRRCCCCCCCRRRCLFVFIPLLLRSSPLPASSRTSGSLRAATAGGCSQLGRWCNAAEPPSTCQAQGQQCLAQGVWLSKGLRCACA